ncbi:protoporphyrinogen IX oxidase [Rhodocytophaga rosea]|uniref:Protoporphyrinogen IX oxidase n=1 Tax=Rhodocytophaga rosea TaxID=2704465 RepID=A0A6C0GR25_9BACT|nr:CopD family protein [Rhodocytophaga rosea]QHT70516.1 protoporphyrinogen IX oxidase [Rhodocytophaga rosea]
MNYLYIKALHIIFIVTWFAGLFYMPRLLIYFVEAADRPEPEKNILQKQYALMQRRLWYGITWPSALFTLVLGGGMFYLYGAFPQWLQFKLFFVALLYVYHFWCHIIFKQQQAGIIKYSSLQLRIFNEVATIFLVSIVFLVVLKSTLSMLWGLLGLILFIAVLLMAIRIYKKIRESKST